MTVARWLDNARPDGPLPNSPLAAFAIAYVSGWALDTLARFPSSLFLLPSEQESLGWALVSGTVPMIFMSPFAALFFHCASQKLIASGHFGLSMSIILGVLTVWACFATILALLSAGSTPPTTTAASEMWMGILLWSTFSSLGYGLTIGVVFWLRMAAYSPRWFLKDPKGHTLWFLWIPCLFFINMLSQVFFHRVLGW